jgi:transposase
MDKVELNHDKKVPFKRLAPLDGQLRTYKVLMLPTKEQKVELKRCFAVARNAYNFANMLIKSKKEKVNMIKLRAHWFKLPKPTWANEKHTAVNCKIQAYAIKQCVDAYRTNLAKPGHVFEVGFRSLRATKTETLVIEKDPGDKKQSPLLRFEKTVSQYMRRRECLAFFGNNLTHTGGIRLLDSRHVIKMMLKEGNRLKENAKIQWDKRTGKFHFIYAYVQPNLEDPDPSFADKRIVAMDPGINPFQQTYSPHSGEYGVLVGEKGKETLIRKCQKLDALQSRIAKRKGKTVRPTRRRGRDMSESKQRRAYKATTRRLKRKLAKERRRVYGWMESAHYDTANFILKDHEIIIQPILQVGQLLPRESRLLSSKVARAMCTWSHYKFRQRLKSAASRYEGRHVFETNEPGTSKTCTHCGFWKADLQLGDKIYSCPQCHIQVDRQLAGARNNFFSAFGQAMGIGWDGVGG